MTKAYYNENDPFAAAWLKNLIAAGLIAPGDVDDRSILDVEAADLEGYAQVHLFAGIGGWSHALRLAGWPDDRSAWTASCPCPPFSSAGKRQKCPECKSRLLVWCPRRTGYAICAACGHAWFADARHLWPEAWRLAAERRPQRILGEQVDSVEGVDWLTGVRGSLEILGYSVGCPSLPACSVGAPHIRQRLWWVADHPRKRREQGDKDVRGGKEGSGAKQGAGFRGGGTDGGMAHTEHAERRTVDVNGQDGCDGPHHRRPETHGQSGTRSQIRERVGDAASLGQCGGAANGLGQPTEMSRQGYEGGFWAAGELIGCSDGKARRVEPGVFPLADGVPGRVGRLRAYGNAIVPQVAAVFIGAAMMSAKGTKP